MKYDQFIEQKSQLSGNFGFDPIYMPDMLFDFQKHIVEWAMKKGRGAIFADTGLGKTLIQLTLAENIVRKTNKNVLILTPLAVAFQFILEAKNIDMSDIEYSKDGKYKTKIVITNYERLHYFDSNDFEAVILDESSILKNFDGATKAAVTSFMKKVKYRMLSTATPSPNDYVELGTSSEALGYLGYTDMLTMFFANNEDTIKPQNIGTKWILKGHGRDKFFEWVSSWSMSIRKPSDLGFSDERFALPPLYKNFHSVKNEKNLIVDNQYQLFNGIARRLTEVREEQRATIEKRCEKAVEIARNHDTTVYWCNFNKEGELLSQLDKESYEIKGSMDIDQKEDLLINFTKGNIKKLITKAKMTAFGLNWQHCNHTIFFPTFSYEQYYQSIRRFWRFGQKNPVTVDLVFSDGQQRVLDSLIAKTKKADELFSKLNANLHQDFAITKKEYNDKVTLPEFV
tara:strand:+ start:56 stop:1420 length:1365 start_codon:yes stop_codon:yes gene_type:complete